MAKEHALVISPSKSSIMLFGNTTRGVAKEEVVDQVHVFVEYIKLDYGGLARNLGICLDGLIQKAFANLK